MRQGGRRQWWRFLTTEQWIARRMARVHVRIDTGCWEWIGATCRPRPWQQDRYGKFMSGKKQVYAHRWFYEVFRGGIGEGLEIDHLCRNTLCVNPWHLEPVTHRVNVMRGISPVAQLGRKTKCVRGHEFSYANTRIGKNGSRSCRACGRHRKHVRDGTKCGCVLSVRDVASHDA